MQDIRFSSNYGASKLNCICDFKESKVDEKCLERAGYNPDGKNSKSITNKTMDGYPQPEVRRDTGTSSRNVAKRNYRTQALSLDNIGEEKSEQNQQSFIKRRMGSATVRGAAGLIGNLSLAIRKKLHVKEDDSEVVSNKPALIRDPEIYAWRA